VGQLAKAVGAPCGQPAFIDITPDLIAEEPRLQEPAYNSAPMQPGVVHGSRYIPGLSRDRQGILHMTVAENRARFAQLALLYGWAATWGDHQYDLDLVLVTHTNIVLLELKNWNGKHLESDGNKWFLDGEDRGASPVEVAHSIASQGRPTAFDK